MTQSYEGHYFFNDATVRRWNSDAIGVYYCGTVAPNGNLNVHYIGRAVGVDGIRGRLLQHLGENKWRDITHFGFRLCSTSHEAIDLEASEIALYSPKYNIVGV